MKEREKQSRPIERNGLLEIQRGMGMDCDRPQVLLWIPGWYLLFPGVLDAISCHLGCTQYSSSRRGQEIHTLVKE